MKTSEKVAQALAAGNIDMASAFMYAETHNQLAGARKTRRYDVPAVLDELAAGVLAACLVEPVTGYPQRERVLARLVARLAVHPFTEQSGNGGPR